MFLELRKLHSNGAIRGYQLGAKYLLTPTSSYNTKKQRSIWSLLFFYKISSISACVIGLICASVFLAFLSFAIIFPSSKATASLPSDTR